MFIFSNLAISLDGKIAPAKGQVFVPLGTPEDHKQMKVLRQKCDAILVGATTLRHYKKPLLAGNGRNQPINIVLSSNLKGFSTSWDFFQHPEIKRVLFVSNQTSTATIDKFSRYGVVKVLPSSSLSDSKIALKMVPLLQKMGIKQLLLEGGGGLMWHFVRHNLIDEYHVTLVPKLIGGSTAPTLVDGVGFSAKSILNLKLCQCRVLGDEIYLTYRKR